MWFKISDYHFVNLDNIALVFHGQGYGDDGQRWPTAPFLSMTRLNGDPTALDILAIDEKYQKPILAYLESQYKINLANQEG